MRELKSPGAKKSILLVTTCFAPENAIGSVRMVKLTKYLVRLGYSITVVSPELDEDTLRDCTLECEELTQTTRITVAQSRWFRVLLSGQRKKLLSRQPATQLLSESKAGVAPRIRAIAFRSVHLFYNLLRNWDWKRQAVRRIRSQLQDQRFGAVVSSYPSLGAMWVASWLRRKSVVPLWIADFRDPVCYEKNSTAISRVVYSRIQQRIVALSDEVTAVSEGIARKLRDPVKRRQPVVLYNGFDPEDRVIRNAPTKEDAHEMTLRLAYVGSLYGGQRDVSVIFDALAGLFESGRLQSRRVQFDYAGKDFHLLVDQASGSGLQSILVDHGMVTRKEALRIQEMSHIVVVATWNSEKDQGVITGKLFECFALRKPILGVVGGTKPGSEFKAIVERVGAGFVFEEAGEVSGEARLLRQYLEEKDSQLRTTGTVTVEYNDHLFDYAYPSHANTISRLIDGPGADN